MRQFFSGRQTLRKTPYCPSGHFALKCSVTLLLGALPLIGLPASAQTSNIWTGAVDNNLTEPGDSAGQRQ